MPRRPGWGAGESARVAAPLESADGLTGVGSAAVAGDGGMAREVVAGRAEIAMEEGFCDAALAMTIGTALAAGRAAGGGAFVGQSGMTGAGANDTVRDRLAAFAGDALRAGVDTAQAGRPAQNADAGLATDAWVICPRTAENTDPEDGAAAP